MEAIDLRYQTQAFLHEPEKGIHGDCARTALACLLELPRDDVPHFAKDVPDSKIFHKRMDDWLHSQGYSRVRMIFSGDDDPETIMSSVSTLNPGLRFQLAGKSKTGVNHVVICKGGKIDHDPSITQSGIVGPCEPNGYYWVEFLTPIRFVGDD